MREASSFKDAPMNTKPFLLASILLVAAGAARSQGGVGGYPFDTPADPRSVAMGESFVALPSNPLALMYNPAGLAGLSGISVSYSLRRLDWVPATDEWRLSSVNATVATSFGVFAAQYNRKSMGTLPVTTSASPDGDGTEMTLYSHDFAVGYALRLPKGPALGVTAKYYDFVESASGPSSGQILPWKTTPAYLFDAGLVYTLPLLHGQRSIQDSITLGMSYQNIGTHWKVATTYLSTGAVLVSSQEITPPQYFRIGLSYALKVLPPDGGDLSPFAAVLSGEFRSLQSSDPTYTVTGFHTATSFWGFGLECTIFEFLSLRGGASFKPYTDFEGEEDRPAFRYGAALVIPMRRIGADLPLTLSLQYTVIPLNQLPYYFASGEEQTSLSAFSIGIQYTGSPF